MRSATFTRSSELKMRTPLSETAKTSLPVAWPVEWRNASLALTGSLVLVAILYWSTLRSMVDLWRTSTFSHGFLVVPMILYLVWERRKRLALISPVVTVWAIPFLAVVGFGWLLGNLSETAILQQLCVASLVVGLVWGVLGVAAVRALMLPLAFLYFAVPFGEGLIPWLQDFSAKFAVRLLDISSVPVLLEGRYITVPGGKWEVAEACSGIRYLVASLALGFVFAGINYRSWSRRIFFFLASVVVPIIANGLRVYAIVLTGYLAGNTSAISVDHKMAGLVFFSLIMLVLFTIGARWREHPVKEPVSLASTEVEARRPEELPDRFSYFTLRTGLLFALMVLLAAAAPLGAKALWNRQENAAPLRSTSVSAPWFASPVDGVNWKPSFLSPISDLIQTYDSGHHTVKLYVAYYGAGSRGGKLVTSSNQLYDRTQWFRTGEGRGMAVIGGQSVTMRQTFAKSPSGNAHLVIWNCYWVDGEFTSNDYFAKFLLARARLLDHRNGTAAIAVATQEPVSDLQGSTVLQDFLRHLSMQGSASIQNNLPQ